MTKTLLSLGLGAGLIFGGNQMTNQAVDIVKDDSAATVEQFDGDIEELLTIAIEDEYKARQTYEAIMDAYGEQNPFANIMAAEETHIAALIPLFEAYNLEVPEDVELTITLPATLEDAYDAGVQAEIDNIAIYKNYLATYDLPTDIEKVFTSLMTASEHHLDAFERNTGISTVKGRSNEPRRMEIENKECLLDAK